MTTRIPLHGAWIAAVLALAGCTDTQIIYRDRELFAPPADSTHGFLGYFDTDAKMTSCGNCHVGKQTEWEATAHADARATLEASSGTQDFCYQCHTVSQQGNAISAAAGWNAVQDDAYGDVQCESCHGPGLTHVENPDATQPIPALGVPAALDNGCVECHSGSHHPFAEQWAQSRHASVIGFAAARPECQSCHQGQGALRAWGVNASYVEKDGADHLPITCGVCHDPHDATYDGQLRRPVNTRSAEENLCAQCHDRRTAPDPGSSHGLEPHAPEMALLLGDAGWFPPNLPINQGRIIASHGSEGNPTLCAACHVNSFTVTDKETGAFQFQSVGHLFKAIPCLDSLGVPTAASCGFNTTERSYASCTSAGCHLSQTAAASALNAATARMNIWAGDLLSQLQQVDTNLAGTGGQIDARDTTFTVAEGAYFNYNLAIAPGIGAVQASATHNPFLTEALLLASIQAVQTEYGVSPASGQPAAAYRGRLQEVLEAARHLRP